MNNKVSNPKKEVSNGMKLNDKDYLTSVLNNLKDIEKNYCIFMTESSNEYLYNRVSNTFNTCSKLQREVFELMFRNGWYELEKAESNKIECKYNTLNNELIKLNENN